MCLTVLIDAAENVTVDTFVLPLNAELPRLFVNAGIRLEENEQFSKEDSPY